MVQIKLFPEQLFQMNTKSYTTAQVCVLIGLRLLFYFLHVLSFQTTLLRALSRSKIPKQLAREIKMSESRDRAVPMSAVQCISPRVQETAGDSAGLQTGGSSKKESASAKS